MSCRDFSHVVEEPEAVPMTTGATDAIVATATPSPIQAGAIVSRRRFQRGNIIIRGKTPRRYGMYREDVLQPNGTFKRVRRCVLLCSVSRLSKSAAWETFQPHPEPLNTAGEIDANPCMPL